MYNFSLLIRVLAGKFLLDSLEEGDVAIFFFMQGSVRRTHLSYHDGKSCLTKLICGKCRAGQMLEYEKDLSLAGKKSKIVGRRCERCGYIQLDNDDDVWAIVGL